MKNLLNPKWLLIVNTLPITLYLILAGLELNVAWTLLSSYDLEIWLSMGAGLLLLAGAVFAYSLRATYQNKNISVLYALLALGGHIAYMILYLEYFDDALRDIPRWMISADFEIYAFTFLMPTLIHAVFVMVLGLSNHKFINPWLNLLAAFLIPFLIFVFVQVGLPFWDVFDSEIGEILGVFLACFIIIAFIFFIIRAVYLFSQRQKERNSILVLIFRILIAVVFPILGLLFNQGAFDTDFSIDNDRGIFGNFGSWSFYIIALLNGILVCLPERENPKYRLVLFAGRAIGFTYVTYFFFVFLPYLPLSIVAVLAVGLGFLMLTPLVLFVMQGQILYNDYIFLKQFNPVKKLNLIVIIGLLILPIGIIINYSGDKKVLNVTLDYIYYPDYSKEYDLNEKSINRVLQNVKSNKKNRRGGLAFESTHTPFLSRFYTWLVLDNMTLSDRKIKKIESIFYGEFSTNSSGFFNRTPIDGEVDITNYKVKSEYDEKQNAWLTWVDFEMTNLDTTSGQKEFDIAFDLPTGCWISDYYLDIEGKREKGILAEKRAAVWIYQQITNTRRDPGLLNYVGANTVRFRIFPFLKNEVRTTGIQFLHKEPTTINIANETIQLGDTLRQQNIETATDLTKNVVYLSAAAKSKLPKVERKPYYHFIIDVSEEMGDKSDDYEKLLSDFINKNKVDINKAEFNFTGKYSRIINGKDWKIALKNQAFQGGFYFERAVKKCLFNAYENRKGEYPIIVVFSKNDIGYYIHTDLSQFENLLPEVNEFYRITSDEESIFRYNLSKKFLSKNSSKVLTINAKPVLAYPNTKNPITYLEDNKEASIVLKKSIINNQLEGVTEKDWKSALTMQANWRTQNLHPEIAEKEYYELLKSSFKSGVMSPLTSFISLENEAQKQMLYKKQREALNGNKAFDIGEQPDPMPEPEIWILLVLFGIFLGIKKIRS